MKSSIIAPMGISPPVVTEFVDYFAIAENITDVVILATQEEKVRESVALARVALKHRYPRIRTHVKEIPFQDILTLSVGSPLPKGRG